MNTKNLATKILLTTLFITNACICTAKYQRQDDDKIDAIQKQLHHLSKYGRSFNFTQRTADIEYALESNIAKLDTSLYQLDASFMKNLDADLKILNDTGYALWWEHGYNDLKNQKDCYLANAKQLKAYFKEHDDFIYSYRLINFYNTFPSSHQQLPAYIRSCYQGNEQYPLIAFKNNALINKTFLEKMQRTAWAIYPCMLKKSHITTQILDQIIGSLCSNYEFQQELDKRKRDIDNENLLAAQRQIAQAEIDKINLMRREIKAIEEANQLKLREIEALEERNRIDKERNQIDAINAGIYYREDR